jgi:hypothetical protein
MTEKFKRKKMTEKFKRKKMTEKFKRKPKVCVCCGKRRKCAMVSVFGFAGRPVCFKSCLKFKVSK